MWPRCAFVLGLCALGCSDEAWAPALLSERLAAADAPIVNGSVDNDDPAVVALTVQGQAFCTATLITPDVVLTAAHCLPPNTSEFGLTSYSQISVFFGTTVGSGQFIQAIDGYTDPLWNDEVFENDIGLLRLSSPGPATPIPYGEAPLDLGDQGAQVRLVGFGITFDGGSDSGIKRHGGTTIQEVFQFVFTTNIDPSITCNGDSGGPTLMTRGSEEEVIGIHSRSDCNSGAVETRTDDYVEAIEAFIGVPSGPQCFGDGACASGCGAPDPDCPCADDTFCTAGCAMPATDPDCAPDCSANGACNLLCTATPDPDCGPGVCQGDECKWIAGSHENKSPGGTLLTDCAMSPRPVSTLALGAILAAAGLFASRRRRS